ncbi:MAG: hypothetical protein M3Y28_05260, partial [Armatimonadota bacterium]|nr:hypothetical protein [Armatimonadota bacterium]
MEIFIVIVDWLLVLALIGLIGTLVWLGLTAVRLKNGLMGDAKRLYEPPLRSGKNLVAASKGIAMQETARAKRVGATVKDTVEVVKDTALDVKDAAAGVNLSDLKPVITNAQSAFRILSVLAQFSRTAPK